MSTEHLDEIDEQDLEAQQSDPIRAANAKTYGLCEMLMGITLIQKIETHTEWYKWVEDQYNHSTAEQQQNYRKYVLENILKTGNVTDFSYVNDNYEVGISLLIEGKPKVVGEVCLVINDVGRIGISQGTFFMGYDWLIMSFLYRSCTVRLALSSVYANLCMHFGGIEVVNCALVQSILFPDMSLKDMIDKTNCTTIRPSAYENIGLKNLFSISRASEY